MGWIWERTPRRFYLNNETYWTRNNRYCKANKGLYRKKYDIKLNHSIEEAIYDTERQCWVVIAVSKLFEQENLFSYFISDDTGKLIKTMDKYGYNTYLPRSEIIDKEILKEWDEYEKE